MNTVELIRPTTTLQYELVRPVTPYPLYSRAYAVVQALVIMATGALLPVEIIAFLTLVLCATLKWVGPDPHGPSLYPPMTVRILHGHLTKENHLI